MAVDRRLRYPTTILSQRAVDLAVAISAHWEAHGRGPSLAELAPALNCQRSSIHRWIVELDHHHLLRPREHAAAGALRLAGDVTVYRGEVYRIAADADLEPWGGE